MLSSALVVIALVVMVYNEIWGSLFLYVINYWEWNVGLMAFVITSLLIILYHLMVRLGNNCGTKIATDANNLDLITKNLILESSRSLAPRNFHLWKSLRTEDAGGKIVIPDEILNMNTPDETKRDTGCPGFYKSYGK